MTYLGVGRDPHDVAISYEHHAATAFAAYEARVTQLVCPNLAAWAHGGRVASGVDPDR